MQKPTSQNSQQKLKYRTTIKQTQSILIKQRKDKQPCNISTTLLNPTK